MLRVLLDDVAQRVEIAVSERIVAAMLAREDATDKVGSPDLDPSRTSPS